MPQRTEKKLKNGTVTVIKDEEGIRIKKIMRSLQIVMKVKGRKVY